MGYCPKCGASIGIETICPYCGERLQPEISSNKELERLREVTNDFRSRPTCPDHELKELIVTFLATASLKEKGIYENRIKAYFDNYLNGGNGIVSIVDSSSYSVSGPTSGGSIATAAGAAAGAATASAASGGSSKGPRKKLSKKGLILLLVGVGALVVGGTVTGIVVGTSGSSKNAANNGGTCSSTRVYLYSEGTYYSSFTVYYGAYMPSVSIPSRYNYDYYGQYKFDGYYSGLNGGGTKYFDQDGNCVRSWDQCVTSASLYANWKEGYQISFNMNGGSSSYSYTKYGFYGDYPSNIDYYDLPTRYGYTFSGFYDSMYGGTQYYNSSGYAVKKWDKYYSATLYAHWTSSSSTSQYPYTSSTSPSQSDISASFYGYNLYSDYYGSISPSNFSNYINLNSSGTYSSNFKSSGTYSSRSGGGYTLSNGSMLIVDSNQYAAWTPYSTSNTYMGTDTYIMFKESIINSASTIRYVRYGSSTGQWSYTNGFSSNSDVILVYVQGASYGYTYYLFANNTIYSGVTWTSSSTSNFSNLTNNTSITIRDNNGSTICYK